MVARGEIEHLSQSVLAYRLRKCAMAAEAPDDLFRRLADLGLLKQGGDASDVTPNASSSSNQSIAVQVHQALHASPEAGQAQTAVATRVAGSEEPRQDSRLNELLRRISELAGDSELEESESAEELPVEEEAPPPRPEPPPRNTPPHARRQPSEVSPVSVEETLAGFVPLEPESFESAQITEGQVESLLLKYLLAVGTATGRSVAEQCKMPFKLIDDLLSRMKNDQLVVYYGSAPMNDYVYQLTDVGRERARRQLDHCTYFGAVPVSLDDYISSVAAQSITHQHPTAEDLGRAFQDLLINRRMLERLGPAINSGRGLFLFGAPGNGKTSIAERVTSAFGTFIWIPRAIGMRHAG